MVKVKRTLEDYKDIINLPHHVSEKRAKMAISNRAAQFAPFSAVVGHDAAIKEAARYTDKRRELDETEKLMIDEKIRKIRDFHSEEHEIKLVYFEPDVSKKGGIYLSKSGRVKNVDSYKREVVFTDGTKISMEEIYSIDL